MRRMLATVMALVAALFVFAVSPMSGLAAATDGTAVETIAKFTSMATVRGAFLGATYPIRGVPGAGLAGAWFAVTGRQGRCNSNRAPRLSGAAGGP